MTFKQTVSYPTLSPARIVTTANLVGSYSNGVLNNGVDATFTVTNTGQLTIDSVDIQEGDSVLLAAQTNANENGIYICIEPGSTGIQPILQRRDDMQCIEQLLSGQYVSITASSSLIPNMFVLVEPLPIRFGIDGLFFESASGPKQLYGKTTAENVTGTEFTYILSNSGLTADSIVVASIYSQTNNAAIEFVVPGIDELLIGFTASPGADTGVYYVGTTP